MLENNDNSIKLCEKCKKPANIFTQHGYLCDNCFKYYVENKVFKTIIKYELIKKDEKIGVAVSGGKDSFTTLHLINRFAQKHKINKPIAIMINEGTIFRKELVKNVKEFCKNENITLKVYSYKEEFGLSLEEMMKIRDKKHLDIHSCNICGTLRRQLLNKIAKDLKLDSLATGHNMDDESQTILMNFFKGHKIIMSRQGIKTGVDKNAFVKRIKPLYFLTNDDIKNYVKIKGFNIKFDSCPFAKESFRDDVKKILNTLENKYSGTKNGIISTFLYILPKIKEDKKPKIKRCKICGQPSQQDICKACEYLKLLKN